jgi:SulP family sulfate permease
MAVIRNVIPLTVFVDLIIAVGLSVFISSFIIEILSKVEARKVKAIGGNDENVVSLTSTEPEIFDQACGKVLFFYLLGPMIFSLSKAISRQNTRILNDQVIILDLTIDTYGRCNDWFSF